MDELHVPVEGPLEDTPQWQAIHDQVLAIGASDAAKACNASEYGTALDLYLRATQGASEPVPDHARDLRLRRGKRMQPVILREYADELEVEVQPNHRMYFHPQHTFCAATPDGVALTTPRYGVEVKATTPHMYAVASENRYGEEGTDMVPPDVLFQAQQQMAVMGWVRVDVVVMFGIFQMRVYPVQRHDLLIDGIVEAEQELMQRIADRQPPEPQWEHPATRKALRDLFGLEPGRVVSLGEADLQLWLEYQELATSIKDLEQAREANKNRLLAALGSAEIGRFPRGEKELRRVVIVESHYTDEDVAAVQAKVGQVKRKGYEQLRERKVQ